MNQHEIVLDNGNILCIILVRRIHMRITKSYSIDQSIDAYVRRTSKGRTSASKRVNELLSRAILLEEYESLEQQAAHFFADQSGEERAESKAFQDASIVSIARE